MSIRFYRFLRFWRRSLPFSLFLLAVCNVLFLWRAVSRLVPRVDVQRTEHTEYVYSVVTDRVEMVTSPASHYSSFVPPSAAKDIDVDFDYYMVGPNRRVNMFGRTFYEGSITSYGRIFRIFPDRIQLENGSYLVNRRFKTSNKDSSK